MKEKYIAMKKIAVLIVLVIGLITQATYAQDYEFRVLANNGSIKVKVVEKKWAALKTGARLNKGDKLKISANSYLGLVHSSGRTMELTEAGTFDITTLSAGFDNKSKNIVSKYADYVISKMTPEVVEQNRKKYASVTGSVERGLYDTDIHLFVPKTVKLLNTNAALTWAYEGENNTYIVLIKNILGDSIFTAETSTPFYMLNFKNDRIVKESIMNIIIVKVLLKNDTSIASQEVAISLLDSDEKLELNTSLSELVSNLGRKSSLNNLILAEFYEEQGLILDAITSYENALIISPDIDYFQEVYNEFLIRNRLKSPSDIDAVE